MEIRGTCVFFSLLTNLFENFYDHVLLQKTMAQMIKMSSFQEHNFSILNCKVYLFCTKSNFITSIKFTERRDTNA